VALAVTVLGCSGTYPSADGACSGYLVEGAGTTVWVDTGPGTIANLQRHTDFDAVDAIVLSHSHPDHWTDLPVLRNVFRYVRHREGVPVYGTAETYEMASTASHDGLEPTFTWTTIADGGEEIIGGLTFSFSQTDHPVETLAVHVREGADGPTLAYSADTGPGWSVAAFDRPVDLFLCEATLDDEHAGQAPHVSAREAGVMAREAGVARLLLTHHWPGMDLAGQRRVAEEAFGGPVELAQIHERYEV
jgi:ribonuclease BN (tRNA processing enzyme)